MCGLRAIDVTYDQISISEVHIALFLDNILLHVYTVE